MTVAQYGTKLRVLLKVGARGRTQVTGHKAPPSPRSGYLTSYLTGGMGVPWELIRNAESLAPSETR